MQAIKGNTTQDWQYYPPRIPEKKYQKRSKPNQTKNSGVRKSNNGFLTTVFKPLHVSLFYSEYSEDNYKYLYESIMNYSRLLKRELQVNYDPFNWKILFEKFGEILPLNNQYKLVINEENKSVKIELWLYDDQYNNNCLYYLPCGIIDQTEGKFREILITFFRLLRHKQMFNVITESGFFEMMSEQLDEDEDEDKNSDWFINLKEYMNGYKSDLLDIISMKPKCSIVRLEKIVSDFKPVCRRESNLKLLILEGLVLLKKKNRILRYGTSSEADYDYYTICIDEVIQIIYEADSFEEEYIRYLNESAQESGLEFISSGKIKLTPTTKRLLKPDKYVINFMNWLKNLNDELYYI